MKARARSIQNPLPATALKDKFATHNRANGDKKTCCPPRSGAIALCVCKAPQQSPWEPQLLA